MALPERTCICGCGRRFTPTHAKHYAATNACRAKVSRSRREERGALGRVVSISHAKGGQVSVTLRFSESALPELNDVQIGDQPRVINERTEGVNQ